jgi:16S rRNA (guanine527-N7)-methyltransferase
MTPRVSRGTPPVPADAAAIFGGGLAGAERFADLLATDGVAWGLIGPREAERLWSRHLLNCAVVASTVPARVAVIDVGSGAGLPGMVWALARPDLEVTLIEPLLRRSRFLEQAVARLGLSNVSVVRARAEELHGHRYADVVTARAVAPMERLARWCLPLVRSGGELIAFKGRSAQADLDASRPLLRSMGATSAVVTTYGEGVVDPVATVIRVLVDRSATGGDS